MAAIAWLLASGALDALDKRDAAKAEAAKAQAATQAELDLYEQKKKIDARIEQQNAEDARKADEEAYRDRINRLTILANQRRSLEPGMEFIPDPITAESLIEIDTRRTNFGSVDDFNAQFDSVNQLYIDQNINQALIPVPDPENPSRFIPKAVELPEDEMAKLREELELRAEFAAQERADVREEEEEARGIALEQVGTLAGEDVELETTVNLGGGVSTTIKPKKESVVPAGFSPNFVDSKGDPIPYGPQFYARSLTQLTPGGLESQRPEVLFLTAEDVPMTPGVEQEEFLLANRNNAVVYNPRESSGNVKAIQDRTRDFFLTFTPEVMRKAIELKADNPVPYNFMKRELQAISRAYALDTRVQTNQFVRLGDPVSDFADDYKVLQEIGDNGLLKAIDSGYTEARTDANTAVGNPPETPPAVNAEGQEEFVSQPTISAAPSLVQRDPETNQPVGYTPKFEQTITRATENGFVNTSEVLGIVSFGIDSRGRAAAMRGETPTPSPEGAALAADGLDTLMTLLSTAFNSRSLQVSSPYAIPQFGPAQLMKFGPSLAPFATLEDKITAVKASLPPAKAAELDANGSLVRGSSPKDVYNLVVGTRTWKEVADETNNAKKTRDTTDRIELLLDQGALVGGLGDIALFKQSIAYFTREGAVALGITGADGQPMDTRLGFDTAQEINGRSYSANSTIVGELNQELEAAMAETNEQARLDALLKFQLRVLSYSYAAMLDPNGRLSDADREAADAAIGNKFFTSPDAIRPVVQEIRNRSNYNFVRGTAYISGDAVQAYSMKLVDANTPGMESVPAVDIIDAYLPDVNGPGVGGANTATQTQRESLREELSGDLGGTPTPATPAPTTPAPAPIVPNTDDTNLPFPIR